jgi:aspartyl-tRNA(Asn)/glutamyl-tRNA(Gln) amidotransferase subunit C
MGDGRATLTAQEIRATAELARLLVSDADLERLRGELAVMLDYAAQLAEVDVTGVPPTTHAVELTCPLRDDVVGRHDSRAEALSNAPASEGAFFVVPAVFAGAAGVSAAASAEGDGTAAVFAGAAGGSAAAPGEADGSDDQGAS